MSIKKRTGTRFWTDWKIGGKVISVVLVISLISVVVLLFVNYLTNVRETNKTVGNQLLVLGDEVILRAADQVLNEVKVLETLSRTPSIIDAVVQANLDLRLTRLGKMKPPALPLKCQKCLIIRFLDS